MHYKENEGGTLAIARLGITVEVEEGVEQPVFGDYP